MKKFLWKLFAPFANEVWWPNWSNFRWRKALKEHTDRHFGQKHNNRCKEKNK